MILIFNGWVITVPWYVIVVILTPFLFHQIKLSELLHSFTPLFMFPFSSLNIRTALLKSMSSKADACIPSRMIPGDLFCSFEWAMIPCFFVCFLIYCWKLGIWKNAHLSQSLKSDMEALYRSEHPWALGSAQGEWRIEVFYGLFLACVLSGSMCMVFEFLFPQLLLNILISQNISS